MEHQITAAILAGGKNSRFGGEDKAFVKVEGTRMIDRILSRIESIFGKIVVVTNSPERYSNYKDLVITGDIYKDSGPLGGIHAGMEIAGTPFIFVFSCDMPFLDPVIIKDQVDFFVKHDDIDALIPSIKSRIEPLHAIYRAGLAEELADFLASSKDLAIRRFLENKRVVYYELPAKPENIKAFVNINRPGDLRKIPE